MQGPLENERPWGWRLVGNVNGAHEQRQRLIETAPRAMVHDEHGVSPGYAFADGRQDLDPDRRVHYVGQLCAPATEDDTGAANILGVQPGHIACTRRCDRVPVRR
jgi:hypothetical protein